MDDVAVALAVHVLGIVVWIGGLSLVTTVLLPVVRRRPTAEGWALFEAVERRFAWQARAAVVVVGASGFYLAWRLELWRQLSEPQFWWIDAMAVLWLAFVALLFVAEPLGAEAWLRRREQAAPGSGFARFHLLHWVLLGLGLVTVLCGVLGSAGGL